MIAFGDGIVGFDLCSDQVWFHPKRFYEFRCELCPIHFWIRGNVRRPRTSGTAKFPQQFMGFDLIDLAIQPSTENSQLFSKCGWGGGLAVGQCQH